MKSLSLALAQLRVKLFDKESNLKRVLSTIEKCKEMGADYILFPELFLSGYFLGNSVKELSEPLDGNSIRLIQKKARENKIGVIVGFPEVNKNHFFNSAVFIEKDGEVKGVYRKVHLYDQEKKIFKHGDDFPVFKTEYGNIGLMITYDMEFPEMARILTLKGAQLILILSSNMVPYQHYQEIYLKARALENHIFVANTNKVGLEEDTLFFGESAVISPNGSTLYKGGHNEDIGLVKINLSEIDEVKEKKLLDYIQNRRPKTYKTHGLV